MPYIGLGLHLLIAIFFAVHAVRTRQQIFWIFILLSFPLLGSVIYFLAIYLPESRLTHHAGKVASVAVKALDPGRELRAAQQAYDYTPTAQNQIRLATALLEAGQPKQALELFEGCLNGVFSGDAEISWLAAQAAFAAQETQTCIRYLQAIRQANPQFRADAVSLLLARAYAAQGDVALARSQFQESVTRHGSFESRAEYAVWAAGQGDWATADALHAELKTVIARWSRAQRDMHREQLRRLETAFSGRR
ncbi:tetratricopeptide repeat protein [Kerstersia gyiorum]|uniref:Tetratricopeptide repeat protein n=1 Tax=Kerstersia gyiorum TaxID=206506 RepID=A0A4V2EZ60_9BURK|nr:tetratricopeptide repeat protein [Kerstersia gyiorum]KAB0542309.1 hypothetical protein F7P85_14015 [Kerstersia gyiorum]MCP1634026.1 hypothetical protein [Kerstersia gyiorum]MCP1637313.1 hypothetical protein [Kerstersia gyiorum]MCP1671893.1 hypothetical protein [Kerstersia gyiorum]MCP1679773.1 hypothetical protein [Kerstersia gyiorum]